MRLSWFMVLVVAVLWPCQSQDAETTTTSEESTTTSTTSTPQIFTAPPVQTSDKTDQAALDFSVEGEDSIASEDEVITGVFMLYANIDQITMQSGDIDIIVRETIGKVCKHFNSDAGAPVQSKMFMDAKTLGQERLGMNYTFHVLPPIEAGKDCINRLAMVSFGPNEPPYGELAPPPLRALMRTEMTAYRPTRFMDMTNWYLSIQNMSCDLRKVVKFWNHSKSDDVFPTESPECLGGESIDWEPNLNGEFKTENVGMCSLAGGDACLCAALPGCEWVALTAGLRKCVWTATPGVDCDSCERQDQCVQTPQKICSSRSMPCTCVLSSGECVWDVSNSSCRYSPNGVTPCIACPRQSFCATPSVTRSDPLTFSIMGTEAIDYSWFINITFDRRMEFKYSGLGTGVSLACRIRYPGDTTITFEFDWSRLAVADNILHVNCEGLSNPNLRDCDLIIQNSALRGVSGLLPYAGMLQNEVLISLPDTYPPTCDDFFPPNSARSIALDAIITFVFSESILISKAIEEGTYTAINIVRLGGNISDAMSDVTVGNISIMDESRVTVDGNNLHVKLKGFLEVTNYYSLTLPKGMIEDPYKNKFQGLARARYIFSTTQIGIVEAIIDPDEESFQYTWIIVVIVGGVILLVALFLGYKFCLHIKSTNKTAKVMAIDNTPKFITTVKEDGSIKQTAPAPEKFVHEDGDNDDWSLPMPDTYASARQQQNNLTVKSITMGPSGARSPGKGAIAAQEFMRRADKPQVQVMAKPDDPKAELRSQLRRAGSMVSLAEQRENSVDTFKRLVLVGGASGSPSPTAERRTPNWSPTHQAASSNNMSPKSGDRRSRMTRSSTSLSARGAMSPTSTHSARGMTSQSRQLMSPKSVGSPASPNQAPAVVSAPASGEAMVLRPE